MMPTTMQILQQLGLIIASFALIGLTAHANLVRGPDTADQVVTRAASTSGTQDAASSVVSTAAVRRGPLAETIILQGRVAGTTEIDVTMPRRGRVSRLLVDAGQLVGRGAPLVDIALAPPEDGPQADDDSGDNMKAEQERLRRVIEELDRLRSMPSAFGFLAEQTAVAQARANLQRLEAELAKQSAGPNLAERRLAEHDADVARAELRRAETEQERLLRGADAAAVRRAEGEVLAAESDLARSQTVYRQIVRGPDSTDVRTAEREVEQAEETLRLARGIKPVPLPTPTARPSGNGNREVRAEREARSRVAQDANNQQLQQELAIRQAETALESARDRLTRLLRGPGRVEVEAAARDVETATRRLADARERLTTLRQGPDRTALDAAATTVAAARNSLARAEKRLADLEVGTPPEQLVPASAAIISARLALQAAEARLVALVTREIGRGEVTSDSSVRDEAVRTALAGPAGSALRAAIASGATGERLAVAPEQGASRSNPTLIQIGAPVDGVVSAIQAETDAFIEAGQAIVTLATSDERFVRVPLHPHNRQRVVSGMPVAISLDNDDTGFSGHVTVVEDVHGVTIVAINVDWRGVRATPGTTVQAAVTLGRRTDTLSVPATAVRDIDSAPYVDVVEDGQVRRLAVATGLETATEVEILAGLHEGQVVRLTH